MDIKRGISFYKSDNLLLSDSAYYKYIFKKTEKIVCTVFYIVEHSDKGQDNTASVSFIESAKRTLDAVLKTLSISSFSAYQDLYAFLHALVSLESATRVAQATGVLSAEIADLLSLEISTVARAVRQYIALERSDAPGIDSFGGLAAEPASTIVGRPERDRARSAQERMYDTSRTPSMTSVQKGPTPKEQTSYKGQHLERRNAIKDILASKGQSTIKDICEKMPEYKEKTIQREVISMIKDGLIVKDGDRRWSRYSLAPGV
ncbi:hypothetical protein HY416_02555 [Candidatus Kaiserbacteria bacterium]|nr:hypothetical protein [Candidatus Kaiserbacteria bacterium]